jgi:putative thioredoxin
METIEPEDFQTKVVENSRNSPVVVQFGAEWCAPCKSLKRNLEDHAPKSILKYYFCDVDECAELFESLQRKTVPIIAFYKDGELKQVLDGVHAPSKIEDMANQL